MIEVISKRNLGYQYLYLTITQLLMEIKLFVGSTFSNHHYVDVKKYFLIKTKHFV